MASNNNEDWQDLPKPKNEGKDWADIPQKDPGVTPDSADKFSRPKQQYMSPGESATNNYWTNVKARLSDPEKWKAMALGTGPAATPSVQGMPPMVAPASSLPSGISKLAGFLAKNPATRVGSNAAIGATEGAINNPDNRTSGALLGAGLGAGAAALGEGVSGVSNKLADYLMQKSVGMRKYFPGIGNKLADLGMVGTRNQMVNQAESKLASEESDLQSLVKDLTGTVNSKEIADAVAQRFSKFTLPSTGGPSPFSESELSKVRGLTDKLSGMGELSGPDLLALKRQGDYQGFTASGTPATSTESELGRAGADAARQALKKLSPEAADSLLNEQALIKAKSALDKPDSIHQGVGSSLFFGKVPGQSLMGSLSAQALQKGSGRAGATLANPMSINEITKKITEK